MSYHDGDSGEEIPFFHDTHIDGSMNRFDTFMTAIIETTLQIAGGLQQNKFRDLGDSIEVISRAMMRTDDVYAATTNAVEALMACIWQ